MYRLVSCEFRTTAPGLEVKLFPEGKSTPSAIAPPPREPRRKSVVVRCLLRVQYVAYDHSAHVFPGSGLSRFALLAIHSGIRSHAVCQRSVSGSALSDIHADHKCLDVPSWNESPVSNNSISLWWTTSPKICGLRSTTSHGQKRHLRGRAIIAASLLSQTLTICLESVIGVLGEAVRLLAPAI